MWKKLLEWAPYIAITLSFLELFMSRQKCLDIIKDRDKEIAALKIELETYR